MDLGSILLLLGILLLVGLYISQPLIRKSVYPVSSEEQELSSLLAKRDQVLEAIQDLEFDSELGKVPKSLYPIERAALIQRGIKILQSLDKYKGEMQLDDKLSQFVEDLGLDERAASHQKSYEDADDELEVMIANRKRARKDKSDGFCPHCGCPIQRSDHFCPRCGKSIKDVQ